MAKSICGAAGSRNFPDNSTQYQCPVGAIQSDADIVADESRQSIVFRDSVTVRKLQVVIPTNTATVTSTITVRKNGANTAIVVSVDPDETGTLTEDTPQDVAYAAGDTMSIQVSVPTEAGTNNLNMTSLRWECDTGSDNNTVVMVGASGGDTNRSLASTVYYFPVNSDSGTSSPTVANNQARMPGTYVSKGLSVIMRTNATVSTDTTFRSDVNGSPGNQICTVPSGSTARVTDTSNSDTLGSADLLAFSQNNAAEAAERRASTLTSVLTNTSRRFLCITQDNFGEGLGFGVTRYNQIDGMMSFGSFTTEAPYVQVTIPFDCTAAYLAAHVSANTGAGGGSTVYYRDNSVDSGLNASHGASATGWQTGTTEVTVTADSDESNLKLISSHTSGQTDYTAVVVEFYTTAAGRTTRNTRSHMLGDANAVGFSTARTRR